MHIRLSILTDVSSGKNFTSVEVRREGRQLM
jgi:hypothetical protein